MGSSDYSLALTALPCPAADSAVLRNGFTIRHERREVIGTITRLYVDGDKSSFVDVPTEEIDHFETLPVEAEAVDSKALDAKKDSPASPSDCESANLGQPLDLNELIETASGTYRLDPGPGEQRDSRGERLQRAGSIAEGRAGTDAIDAGDRVRLGRAERFRSAGQRGGRHALSARTAGALRLRS